MFASGALFPQVGKPKRLRQRRQANNALSQEFVRGWANPYPTLFWLWVDGTNVPCSLRKMNWWPWTFTIISNLPS
jgi:hypothetical protein